jgi:CheY-like chemotaxis protein
MAKRILIIDDEPTIVMFLSELLADKGYVVLTAYTGDEGLGLLERESPFHLIITDLMLPGTSGQEVVRRVRENPRYDRVPIIIITGSINIHSYPEKGSYQALAYKPFEIEEFLTLVEKFIL